MRLKSIELKNIRSYLDGKIEFPEGSVLLAGDIGCGKSTLLLATEFALFGLKKGELSGSDILRHGKDSGFVRLDMDIDGKNVTVERNLKRSRNIMQDSGRLIIDSHADELSPTELKSKILEIFGYPQDLLKKNKPIFRFTVYTPQEQMKQILLSDDKLDTLRSIFGIDKYGTIRNNSRIFMTELRAMSRELGSIIKMLDYDISRLDDAKTQKNELERSIANEKSLLFSINSDFESKRRKVENLKEEFNSVNNARIELTRNESELRSNKFRLENLEAEIKTAEERISRYKEIIDTTIPDMDRIRKNIAGSENERDMLLSNQAVLMNELKKLQNVYTKGVCEMCGQKVHNPEEFAMHIETNNKNISELKYRIEEINAQLAGQRGILSSAEKQVQTRSVMKELENSRDKMASEKTRIGQNIESLNSAILLLQPRCKGHEELRQTISAAEADFYEAHRKKSHAESSMARYEQQMKDVEKKIEDIENKVKEKEKTKAKIERISTLIEWFEPFINLMEAMEKHVLASVQREFDNYFQKWFSMLMPEQLAVRIDEKFSPVIEQNSFQTEYTNLSGGEKTSVALAYRLALNKVINEMIDSIKTKDILILDEPTDGFSSDQLDRIRDVINELGLKQIIIVSHEPKIDTYVDSVVRIYKEDHVSRVAV